MGSTNTLFLGLKKPEHRDPNTFESWDVTVNHNMDLIDAAVGAAEYTTQNFVRNAYAIRGKNGNLDKLDVALKAVSDVSPTTDQKAALAGTGTPSSGNPYVTKDSVFKVHKFVMIPEFNGVFSASPGGENDGIMDTDMEVSPNDFMYTFYKWAAAIGLVVLQSYDLILQWRVPETFQNFIADAGKALIVDVCTQSDVITNCKVDVYLSKDGADSSRTYLEDQVSIPNVWASERENSSVVGFSATDGTLSALAAGDTLNIRIRMSSLNPISWVKIGAVTIQGTW